MKNKELDNSDDKIISDIKTKDKKSKFEYLQKSAWFDFDKSKVMNFCEGYKIFLSYSKTEYEASKNIMDFSKKKGYVDVNTVSSLKKGDKVYFNNRNRNITLVNIGTVDISKGVHIIVSHVDSPRLDLKPKPFVDDGDFLSLKTHYYGGIKKYQWLSCPLALHGFVNLSNGKKVELVYGEKDDESCFVISDLLPHLGKLQMEKKASEVVTGEQLNVLFGSIPVNDDNIKSKIKEAIFIELNKKYGIVEKDFLSSDLSFVPKNKPTDVGFDKSFVGAYGQDDKGCAYLALNALFDSNPKYTSIVIFADKEEIGSDGNTGSHTRNIERVVERIITLLKSNVTPLNVFENSKVISADVTAGFDPVFKEVHDEKNAAKMGYGVAIERYTGYGGKYSSSHASGEFCRYIMTICEKNNVSYQFDELGKVDEGGGGTVAKYFAQYGCDVIDIGFPVLGMHSPFEISSKVDLYNTYLFYKAFLEDVETVNYDY
ncbi:MAG: aminopeptidase [Candidatus Woesearchaeota archaeon]|jgi:aspartyl aminopeptidase